MRLSWHFAFAALLLAGSGGELVADDHDAVAAGETRIALLEAGPLPLLLERFAPATALSASLVLPQAEGSLVLVDLWRESGSSLWLLRRTEDGTVLGSAQEGWNDVEIDRERELRRRLHLTLDRARLEVRYRWGETLFASGFQEGAAVPQLEAALLSGAPFSLADLSGRVVVLNWWAIWCAPCIEELPLLNELVRENEHLPVEFVAIAENSAEEVRDFLRQREFLYRQAVATETTAKALGASFPRHVVIAADGTVVYSRAGFGEASINRLREVLRLLPSLAESGESPALQPLVGVPADGVSHRAPGVAGPSGRPADASLGRARPSAW